MSVVVDAFLSCHVVIEGAAGLVPVGIRLRTTSTVNRVDDGTATLILSQLAGGICTLRRVRLYCTPCNWGEYQVSEGTSYLVHRTCYSCCTSGMYFHETEFEGATVYLASWYRRENSHSTIDTLARALQDSRSRSGHRVD